MNFINSWSSKIKQNDKINITLRLGRATIVEIKYDISDKALRFIIAGFGIERKGKIK